MIQMHRGILHNNSNIPTYRHICKNEELTKLYTKITSACSATNTTFVNGIKEHFKILVNEEL
jgi:hypothetical protein